MRYSRETKNSFLIILTLFIVTNFALCFSQENNDNNSLIVKSNPDSALTVLDDDTLGLTPISKDNIAAKIYNLKIIKSGYFKKNIEVDITGGGTYHLDIKLISKKRIQILRRISFSVLSLVFSGVSALMITKVNTAEKEKKEAWDSYMQLNLSTSEYDILYETYENKTNETNKLINIRNTCITIAGLSIVGFSISIPF